MKEYIDYSEEEFTERHLERTFLGFPKYTQKQKEILPGLEQKASTLKDILMQEAEKKGSIFYSKTRKRCLCRSKIFLIAEAIDTQRLTLRLGMIMIYVKVRFESGETERTDAANLKIKIKIKKKEI